jgi:hypothetical protein
LTGGTLAFCAGEEIAAAMQITSFKDMYVAELQELASMEKQIAEALLHMFSVA